MMQKVCCPRSGTGPHQLDRSQGEPPGSWTCLLFLALSFSPLRRVNNPRVRWWNYRWPCSLTGEGRRERATSGIGSIWRNGCKNIHPAGLEQGGLRTLLTSHLRSATTQADRSLPGWSQHSLPILFSLFPHFLGWGVISDIECVSLTVTTYIQNFLWYVWSGWRHRTVNRDEKESRRGKGRGCRVGWGRRVCVCGGRDGVGWR